MEVENLNTQTAEREENCNKLNEHVAIVTQVDHSETEDIDKDELTLQTKCSSHIDKNSIDNELEKTNNHRNSLSQKQIHALLDSDSEDDTFPLLPSRARANRNVDGNNSSVHARKIEDSDSSGSEQDKEKKCDPNKENTNNNARYKALLDSESEDEASNIMESPEEVAEQLQELNGLNSELKKNIKSSQLRKGSHRASKEEAMKQIHSETQRLIRESQTSLPYHVPKQRKLEEFLSRKKVISTLPTAPTMTAKLKMASTIVNEVLEEKEKEANVFYKSSDSEDDAEEVTKAQTLQQTSKAVNAELVLPTDDIPIEETQKMMKNMQECRKKKEVLQQGSLDLGIPRKLFTKGEEENIGKDLSSVSKYASMPRNLLEAFHVAETNPIHNSEQKTNEEVIKEVLDQLIFAVEQLDKEHRDDRLQFCVDENMSVIGETPHMSREEVQKLLSNDGKYVKDEEEKAIPKTSQERSNEIPKTDELDTETLEELFLNLPDESNEAIVVTAPESKNDDSTSSPAIEIKRKLLCNLPSVQPKLRSAPGGMIDLTQDVKPGRKGVDKLLDRFFHKHSKTNKYTETGDVTVVHVKDTLEGPIAVKESLPYKVPTLIEEDPEMSKPGAKLICLKEQLKQQIAKKRNEEWKEKERQEQEEEEIFEDEDSEYEDEQKVKCNDSAKIENAIEDDNEDVEDEEEPEENDVYIKESKRPKCAFADDEAEVSDHIDTDCDIREDDDEDEEGEDEEEDEDEDEDGDEDEDENQDKNEEETGNKDDTTSDITDHPLKRNLKRIIKPFDEESNECSNNQEGDSTAFEKNPLPRTATDVDMFETDNCMDTWGSDEADIPITQPGVSSENAWRNDFTPLTKKNPLSLISPATQLTALNVPVSSSSETPIHQNLLSPVFPSASLEKPITPSTDLEKRPTFQKKLFNDEESSQALLDKSEPTKETALHLRKEPEMSESQLLELCSGSFTTQPVDPMEFEESQDAEKTTQNSKYKSEERLLQPSLKEADDLHSVSKATEFPRQLRIVSSDDEEEEMGTNMNKKKLKKRRRIKKLQLSDDEDDEDNDGFSDDEEREEEETVNEEVAEEEKFIDYDSEENEVVVVPKKDIKKYAAGFVDEEAELSESDWEGSDDEDENGMDKLEVEEGDEEELDDDNVKKKLGEFHVKQILDEDQREVRILKELLFEDGDLHTDEAGRERRFKWKNIDKLGDLNLQLSEYNDGYVDIPEDETDVEWRKAKLEREKFLAEQTKIKDGELDEVFTGSQIFQLGMKALQRSKTSQSKKEKTSPTSEPTRIDPKIKFTFSEMLSATSVADKDSAVQNIIKRRSLLARGDASLARLAMIVRQSEAAPMPENTKNCVFSTVKTDDEQQNDSAEQNNERELDITRRKRKAFPESSSRFAKRPRTDGKPQRGGQRGRKAGVANS